MFFEAMDVHRTGVAKLRLFEPLHAVV